MNILYVCMANVNRSPTFELYFKTLYPEHNHRSAGTYVSTGTGYTISEELCEWADKIFVMDIEQVRWFAQHMPQFMDKIESTGFPDEYDRYSWKICWDLNIWNNWRKPFGEVRNFSQKEWKDLVETLQ